MIILNVGIGYDLCELDCQKKKKKKSTGTLRCLSHALDPLGFGILWGLGRDNDSSSSACTTSNL